MLAEDLLGWLTAARRGEKGDTADKEGGGQEGTQEGAENWVMVKADPPLIQEVWYRI